MKFFKYKHVMIEIPLKLSYRHSNGDATWFVAGSFRKKAVSSSTIYPF